MSQRTYHRFAASLALYAALLFLVLVLAGCSVGGGFATPFGDVETRASVDVKPRP